MSALIHSLGDESDSGDWIPTRISDQLADVDYYIRYHAQAAGEAWEAVLEISPRSIPRNHIVIHASATCASAICTSATHASALYSYTYIAVPILLYPYRYTSSFYAVTVQQLTIA